MPYQTGASGGAAKKKKNDDEHDEPHTPINGKRWQNTAPIQNTYVYQGI